MKDKLTDYFNGRLSYEEEQRVQQWLAKNAESELVSKELERLFDSCQNSFTDSHRQVSIYNAISRKLSLGKSSGIGRRIAGYAAATFVSAALCLFFFLAGNHHGQIDASSVEWLEEKVPNASTRQIQLSDGTILSLAPGTRITYPDRFIGPDRRIFVDGEIFAEVAKDADHPFIISSEGTQVKVLGTTFNFRSFSGSSDIALALMEGSVQMQFNTDETIRQVMVTPGQRVSFDRTTNELRTEKFDIAASDMLFADMSSFYYNNMRLQDIAADLSRHFDRKIVITNESLAQSSFFAIFTKHESLDQILGTMALNHSMKVRCSDGVYYISPSR